MNRILSSLCTFAALLTLAGCGTTTTGTATEQLLISNAVDQAIGQIDFSSITGKKVYLETDYYKSLKGTGFVNSEYITSSIRQQLTAARCYLQEKREAAEIIIEPRVGALGTNGHEIIYGIPQNNSLTNAASALSSAPLPVIPEISIGKVNAKSGVAKLIVFAYDRESREPIWQSGIAKAEATSRDTWMFGAGPFQKGTIHDGTRFAGERIEPPQFQKMVFAPAFRPLESPFGLVRHEEDADEEDSSIEDPPTSGPSHIPVDREFFFLRQPSPDFDR